MIPNLTNIIIALSKVLKFGGQPDHAIIPRAEPKSGRTYPDWAFKLPLTFSPAERKQVHTTRINGGKPKIVSFHRPVKHQDRSKYTGAMIKQLQSERGCGRPIK